MSDDLKEFSDGLRKVAEQREAEKKSFNERLGAPEVFIPSEEDTRFGTGYWRANGGVISYRKYANGFDPWSRNEYSSDWIEMLYKINSQPFVSKEPHRANHTR